MDGVVRPHNIEAEQAVLGACLLSRDALDRVSDLRADHFFDPVHGRIFEMIQSRHAAGELVSPVVLRAVANQIEGIDELGGSDYLARLATCVTSLSATPDFAAAIKELAARRTLALLAEEIASEAANPVLRLSDTMERAEAGLSSIREAASTRQPYRSLSEAADEAFEEVERAMRGERGNRTGLADLDATLGGLHPGDLIVIAGRPGMGKSLVGTWLAAHQAAQGRPSLIFSREMSAGDVALRIVSSVTAARGHGVSYSDLRRGTVSDDAFLGALRAARAIEAHPLTIAGPDIRRIGEIEAGIRSFAKRARSRGDRPGCAVIDYLGLIARPDGDRSDVSWISEVTASVKAAALRAEMPVILLSQLNRKVEAREDKRPMLADLRDSGSIEQDADVVIFCYREAYYLERAEPKDEVSAEAIVWSEKMLAAKDKLDLIVAKQRNGPIRAITVGCDLATNRLWDLDPRGQGSGEFGGAFQ